MIQALAVTLAFWPPGTDESQSFNRQAARHWSHNRHMTTFGQTDLAVPIKEAVTSYDTCEGNKV